MSDDPKSSRRDSLNARFNQGSEERGDATQTNKTSKTEQTEQTEKAEDNATNDSNGENTKDDENSENNSNEKDDNYRPSTADKKALTMHLDPDIIDDLDFYFQELALEYRRETGEKLRKIDQFYPAVIEAARSEQTIGQVLGVNGGDE